MKKTSDGQIVPNRCWYYLLDWNEVDKWDTLQMLYRVKSLKELNHAQFMNLLSVAANADVRLMAENKN